MGLPEASRPFAATVGDHDADTDPVIVGRPRHAGHAGLTTVFAAVSWLSAASSWQHGAWAWWAMGLEALFAVGYLLGVRRLAALGRRWPKRRTASFLGGVLVLVIVLQSGLASLDDIFAVHNIQHLALMMVAPPLLIAGAPLVLGLAAGGPLVRRTIRSLVRDPSMRLAEGRFGLVALTLDYYGTMFVYLLTPLYHIAATHPVVHELVHFYFFGCGLVFWHGLIGTSTRRWRRSAVVDVVVVALGAPAMTVLGLVIALRGSAIAPGSSSSQVTEGAVALIVGGMLVTGIGIAIMATEIGRRRARGPGRYAPVGRPGGGVKS